MSKSTTERLSGRTEDVDKLKAEIQTLVQRYVDKANDRVNTRLIMRALSKGPCKSFDQALIHRITEDGIMKLLEP